MASIKDVAKLAEVGIGTVSRVINHNTSVRPETRERVEKAIETLQYRPNEVARSFKKQSTKLIGLMIPTVWHPFFSKMAFFIENELYNRGYKLLLCNSETDMEKELQYVELLRQNQVAGIIIISYHDFYNTLKIDFPLVTIDRYISKDIPHIACDNYLGGVLATEALIKGGCKKLAYVGGGSRVESSITGRKDAFMDVCLKHQIPFEIYEEIVHYNDEADLVVRFLNQQIEVDGVFTSTDMFAATLVKECTRRNIKVPEDMQVVGFDGIQESDLFYPYLSTIKQPVEQMARKSVQLLIERIDGHQVPHETILGVEYIKGTTSIC